jgi:hypothetical protein
VRARSVAARDKHQSFLLQCLESRDDVLRSLDARRITVRPDQDEVVVHDGVTLNAEAFRQELFLLRFVMDEHHIGGAAAPRLERLASSLSDDPHLYSRFGLEQRQDVVE